MTSDTAPDMLDALEDLLERERSALTSGDMDTIARLMQQKEDIVGQLNAADLPADAALDELRAKAERNQVLFDSALAGIRAVSARIAELRHMRQGSETYDRHGRKAKLTAPQRSRLEKRA